MTKEIARKTLQALGITLTKHDGEYRVAFKGTGNEDGAYYTNDLADAVATGRTMAAERVCSLAPSVNAALESAFGDEWRALGWRDKHGIIRDCTEDGGVQDFAKYRANIGANNLQAYANVMRVRFLPSCCKVARRLNGSSLNLSHRLLGG